MESKESFASALAMTGGDTVPFFPRDLTLGLDAAAVRTDEVFGRTYDHKLSAACVLALQGAVGHDVTSGCIFSYSLEAFGGEMRFPPDGIPYASGYPFDDVEKIDDHDPGEIICPLTRGMRSSCEIVAAKRPDLALSTNVAGPVTLAGFFRGLEPLMMDLILNRDIAERIVGFSTDAAAAQMSFMAEGLSDAAFLASASDNPDIIGVEDYVKLSLPSVAKLSDRARSMGIPTIFHPHGVFSTDDRMDALDASVRTGIAGFQFAEGNEPSGILEACDGRCAILGGVNAYSTLLMGPEARIVRDTERFLDELSGHNYIMTCSCSVNRGLPIGNLKVVADVVRKHNGGAR